MFDLATTVLAAPLVVPMDINIDPNSDGLPGICLLYTSDAADDCSIV